MTPYIAIPLIMAAGVALLLLGRRAGRREGARLVRNPEVDRQLFYQPISVAVAAATVFGISLLLPESANYFQVGALQMPVTGVSWMGIDPAESWLTLGFTLGLMITAVTTVVVWLQARRREASDSRCLPRLFLLAIPFAFVNAAVEEAIFRIALCNALGASLPMMSVALISGLLFGLPHYFGHPGKLPGIILAGFLGWLLTLSVLQTGGIVWALALHFVQDQVIFTLLFAVAETTHTREASSNAATDQQP